MQLGTRWAVGATPPDRLPAAMVAAVAEVEAEVAGPRHRRLALDADLAGGPPVVELDDGTTLRYDPQTRLGHDASDG